MAIIRQLKQYNDQQSWIEYNIGSIDTYVSLATPGYYTSATSAVPTSQEWLENITIEDQMHDVESLLKNVNTRLTQIETVTIPSLVTTSVFQSATANLNNAINSLSNNINTFKKTPIIVKTAKFLNLYLKAGEYGYINGTSASSGVKIYKDKNCTKEISALKITSNYPILGVSTFQLPKGTSASSGSFAWGESCIVRQNINIQTNPKEAYVTVAIKNFGSKVSCNDLYVNYFVAPV